MADSRRPGSRSGVPSRSGSSSGSGSSRVPSRGGSSSGSGSSRVPSRGGSSSGGGSSRVPSRGGSSSGSGSSRVPSRGGSSSGSGSSRVPSRGGSASGTAGRNIGARMNTGNNSNVVPGGLNIILFILTTLLGFGDYILSKVLYDVMKSVVPRPVIIGLIFMIFFLALNFLIMGWIKLTGDFVSTKLFAETWKYIVSVAVGTALAFGMGALFQWIYQMEPKMDQPSKPDEPTSIVFIIDDSGSTSSSDPHGKRYSAIAEVMANYPSDMPYMVYSFASDVKLVRAMAPSSGNDSISTSKSSGMTEIGLALETAYGDFEAGKWTNCGSSPRVVFMSDGSPSDNGEFVGYGKILTKYKNSGIIVNSVGLMYANDNVMQSIANKTGGVYVRVDNAASLGTAMTTAVQSTTNTSVPARHLFNLRQDASNNTRCMILRVVFLVIMGAFLAFFKACSVGFIPSFKLTLITSFVQGLIAAGIMEFITQALRLKFTVSWMILSLLWGATIAIRPRVIRRQRDNAYEDQMKSRLSQGSGREGTAQSIDDGSSSRGKER